MTTDLPAAATTDRSVEAEPPIPESPDDGGGDVRPPSRALDAGLSLLLVVGYGAPLVWLVGVLAASAMQRVAGPIAPGVLLSSIGLVIVVTVIVYRAIRGAWRRRGVRLAEALILLILPVWGLGYSHLLGKMGYLSTSCSVDDTPFRPFAEPEVFGLVAFHAATALAYVVSRRRPGALRFGGEALLCATLVVGVVMQSAVAVHVARWIPVGIALLPVFLPCLTPLLTLAMFGAELRARLLRRGREARLTPPPDTYRVSHEAPPEPGMHRPLLLRALALSPCLLGLHAVIQGLWLGRIDGAIAVFTRTCGHMLSAIPVSVVEQDCHYLCTVAARGHTWLVRPERLGKRRGATIVVNRQLAIANAFEDLLHERWPRFGRLARATYDRVGLPLSRYIRSPWASDAVFLAMKPAEWLFSLTLLLLDPREPEDRIGRMYR